MATGHSSPPSARSLMRRLRKSWKGQPGRNDNHDRHSGSDPAKCPQSRIFGKFILQIRVLRRVFWRPLSPIPADVEVKVGPPLPDPMPQVRFPHRPRSFRLLSRPISVILGDSPDSFASPALTFAIVEFQRTMLRSKLNARPDAKKRVEERRRSDHRLCSTLCSWR